MSETFSPEESAARAMLLLHGKSPLDAIQTMEAVRDATARVFANSPDPSDAEIDAAVEHAIRSLGYATDLASVRAMHEAMSAAHAGLWSGRYTLVDSLGDVHALTIGSTAVRLALDCVDDVIDVPSEGDAYANRRIQVDNDLVTADLLLSTSADDLEQRPADQLSALADTFQVFVAGTLVVKADGKGARSIQGKLGVATPAGVFSERGEDPAFVWDGTYQLRFTDTDDWAFHDDFLHIACDAASGRLSLTLGKHEARDVRYRNSVIGCAFEFSPGATTRVTLQMDITSTGSRKCYLWFDTAGQGRTLTGYATKRLDNATLWRKPGEAARPIRAHAGAARLKDIRSGHFFDTPYDLLVPAGDLIVAPDAAGAVGVSGLLTGTTLELGDGTTATGYGVEETDSAGNTTGRIALFKAKPGPAGDGIRFPAGARAKGFQALDEARRVMPGAANTQVGILVDKAFELPALVETDFYEVRVSITGLTGALASGVRIALAMDDIEQPRLLSLQQPEAADTQPPDANAAIGIGPDAATKTAVPDFSKASVLVRNATGETQVVGHKDYYFGVLPSPTTGWVEATRTIYRTDADGTHAADGVPVDVWIPILLHVPIEMDSRDALAVSGDQWAPAARGKRYVGRVTAAYGQQPFTWRVVESDLPGGLKWDQDLAPNKDLSKVGLISFGVTGTVGSGEDPGNTYQPRIRVMSEASCVMKPALATPQITIAEPELENRAAWEISNSVVATLAGLMGFAALFVAILAYRRDGTTEKKADLVDNDIKLKDMSSKTLHEFSQTFNDLAHAADSLDRNKDYIDTLETRLDTAEKTTKKLEGLLETLKRELAEAQRQGKGREVIELSERVERKKRETEGAKKEKHDAEEKKEKNHEKNHESESSS